MIKLDISTLIFFYILFSVIFILIAWLVVGYKGRKNHLARDKDYIWKCSVCFHNYIDSRHDDLSICPLCGSYNKREEQNL